MRRAAMVARGEMGTAREVLQKRRERAHRAGRTGERAPARTRVNGRPAGATVCTTLRSEWRERAEREEEATGARGNEEGEAGEEGAEGAERKRQRGTGAGGRGGTTEGSTGGGTQATQEHGTHGRNDEEEGRTPQTRKRPQRGGPEPQYDETKRRSGTRRTHGESRAYMERATAGYNRVGAKRRAIEVGVAILTRAAEGRYDWRDAGMRPVKRRRRQYAQPEGGEDGGDEEENAPGAGRQEGGRPERADAEGQAGDGVGERNEEYE